MAIRRHELLRLNARLNRKGRKLLVSKGHDYSSVRDRADNLFSLRLASILGITNSPIDDALVYMTHKLARLVSLTRPGILRRVAEESLEDTIVDLKNYSDILIALVQEERGKRVG